MTPGEMRTVVEGQGFQVTSWVDRIEAAVAWFRDPHRSQAAAVKAPSKIGLHLAMGAEFGVMTANLARNLEEGRVALVETVLLRP
jgi:hypothetical protein